MVELTCWAMSARVRGLTVDDSLPGFLRCPPLLPAFLHWASLLDHCLLYCTLPINSKSCWISFLDQCLILMPPKTFLDLLPSSCSTYTYTMNCTNKIVQTKFPPWPLCVICEWGTLVQYFQVAEQKFILNFYPPHFKLNLKNMRFIINGFQEYNRLIWKTFNGKDKMLKMFALLSAAKSNFNDKVLGFALVCFG